MYDYESIGNRIFKLRTSRGIKQREMGDLLGMAQSTYSDLETGKREMTLDQLNKIAKILGVSPTWLFEPVSNFLTDEESIMVETFKKFIISQRNKWLRLRELNPGGFFIIIRLKLLDILDSILNLVNNDNILIYYTGGVYMKKYFSVLMALIIMVFLLGPASHSNAATIKLNKDKITISQGEYYNLKLTGTTEKATWKSGNTKIFTVSSTGKVYGVRPGNGTVTATVGKNQYKCVVLVATPTVKNYNTTLRYGEIYNIEINNLPVKYKNDVKCVSSDTNSVIIIDGTTVKAIGPGGAYITITFGSYKLKATIGVDFDDNEIEQFIENNSITDYLESKKSYIITGTGLPFIAMYKIEYYNGDVLESTSNNYFLQVYNGVKSEIEISKINSEYTTTKIKYTKLLPNYSFITTPEE